MKRHICFIIATLLGCLFILWKSFNFQKSEQDHFNTNQKIFYSLQKRIFSFQQNVDFCKKHKKEVLSLSQKGWTHPHSRLTVGRFLDKLRSPFQKMTYQCEPEEIRVIMKHSFRITRIIIETESFQDGVVYHLLRRLLTKFPGILMIREINLKRSRTDSSYIIGKMTFEWITMMEDNDKK